MSLWNVALEVHTGRIYVIVGTLGAFFTGLFGLWCLLTGRSLVRKYRRRRAQKL